ncbi:hypothetical protein EDB84DRAFT_1558606 [Lactarius hengduanensis]|nr:hypothetical protein EDB84DRAFT_1558606 [Lactarius hengduanensis]
MESDRRSHHLRTIAMTRENIEFKPSGVALTEHLQSTITHPRSERLDPRPERVRLLDLLPHPILNRPGCLKQTQQRAHAAPQTAEPTRARSSICQCQRRCLGGTTSGAFGVVLSSAKRSGAGDNDAGAPSGERVAEMLALVFRYCQRRLRSPGLRPGARCVSPAFSAVSRWWRGGSGDCWCDEGGGENAGLLEELAPLDGAGATTGGGAVVAVAAPPTGTTGGEYALDIGRVEFKDRLSLLPEKVEELDAVVTVKALPPTPQ